MKYYKTEWTFKNSTSVIQKMYVSLWDKQNVFLSLRIFSKKVFGLLIKEQPIQTKLRNYNVNDIFGNTCLSPIKHN